MCESAEIGRQSMRFLQIWPNGRLAAPVTASAGPAPVSFGGPAVEPPAPLWHIRALRCRSSVVEHPLGKGEVHSSILCGSTSFRPHRRKLRVIRTWDHACLMFSNYRFVDPRNEQTVLIGKISYLFAGFLGPAYVLFKSGPRKLPQSLAWSIGCALGTFAFVVKGLPYVPGD